MPHFPYRRKPPVGQQYKVITKHVHKNATNPAIPTMEMTLTVKSTNPKIFVIHNVLSQEECELIVQLAKRKRLKRSRVGAGWIIPGRTSYGTFLDRQDHSV